MRDQCLCKNIQNVVSEFRVQIIAVFIYETSAGQMVYVLTILIQCAKQSIEQQGCVQPLGLLRMQELESPLDVNMCRSLRQELAGVHITGNVLFPAW